MKKSFMTRVLATGLSVAMAFSLSAATNVSVASAASTPTMASAKFAVRVGGATKSYKASTATRKSYKITKAVVGNTEKATVTVNASGKSIKVAPGTVTGSTVVKITFKNTKTKKSTAKKFRCVVKAAKEETPVVNATKITAASQKKGNTIEVTLSEAVTTAAKADFAITRDETTADIAIDTVAVDEKDGTKVTITTYEELLDGKSYTVTYTASDDAKTQSTAQFTATDGVIADLGLTPLTVVAGKSTTIKYQTIDANGVVLTEKSIGSPASNIEITINHNDGEYTNGNLRLNTVDEYAEIAVAYHTYKYDSTTGLETGVIEKTFKVTAVSSAEVASFEYTVATSEPYNWSTTTKNTQIALEDTAYGAYIRILDTNGEALGDSLAADYSVTSSNNNILIADGTCDGAIALEPVAQGTANLIVSYNGKSVATLPVKVGAKRVLTTVKVSTTSVTIGTGSAALATASVDGTNYIDNAAIGVTVLDQYGSPIDGLTGEIVDSSIKVDNVTVDASAATDSEGNTGISISSEGSSDTGTNTYKITFTDESGVSKSAGFSVAVKASTSDLTMKDRDLYFVEGTLSTTSTTTKTIDTTVKVNNDTASSTAPKTMAVYLAGKNSAGIIVSGQPVSETVSVTAIKVVGVNDGITYGYMASGSAVNAAKKVVTSDAISDMALAGALDESKFGNGGLMITARDITGTTVKQLLPAGEYKVTYTVSDVSSGKIKTHDYAQSFTVVNSQPTTTLKILNTSIGTAALEAALADPDVANVIYDGKNISSETSSGLVGDAVKALIGNTKGGTATMSKALVVVPVTVGTTEYQVETYVSLTNVFTGSSTLSFNNVQSKKAYLRLSHDKKFYDGAYEN